ncbi:hypothetical protein LCGC14_2983490 [marine sediment metagenome]|uniref:Uncharacterized protein n=1 Tax=marine sediment metagenome TaxID=412755 RepID=A0A0F8X6T6_9ZZZZ
MYKEQNGRPSFSTRSFKWVKYSKGFTCKHGPRQWGLVKGKNKVFPRCYHHILKNGKGMSFLDVVNWRIVKVKAKVILAIEEQMMKG